VGPVASLQILAHVLLPLSGGVRVLIEMIYFIQGQSSRKVKIGFTKDSISRRLSQLQTGSPELLKLIGCCNGDTDFEAKLQLLFSSTHSHNEWFYESSELNDYIHEKCFYSEEVLILINSKVANGILTSEQATGLSFQEQKDIFTKHLESMYRNAL